MSGFDMMVNHWLDDQIAAEKNPRRREMLRKGLGHGTMEFLRTIWYPVVGNLHHLYPEWEVRDFGGRYRYLDLAYMPKNAKCCIEIQGYRSHARDIEAWRFKDLCMKQALLVLDGWKFFPIAYLSIVEEPEVCKQLVLALHGKFAVEPEKPKLRMAESEAMRFARSVMRPFTSSELAVHLQRSERQTRRILEELVAKNMLAVENGQRRYRTYRLADDET